LQGGQNFKSDSVVSADTDHVRMMAAGPVSAR